ncbi:MAG: HAD family hydrolase, partial [Promethearchaeota archaeon]
MRFEGLIFDCDGVLVDSEPYSCGTWNIVFKEKYNIDIGSDYTPILGKKVLDTAKYYSKKYKLPTDKSSLLELAQLKEKTYYKIASGKLHPISGVKRVIWGLKELGVKMAVASSGSIDKINFNLSQAGLIDEFQITVSAEDVKHAKPAPDIFLEAMNRLDIEPKKCIIIEDSLSGIIAAKKSGAFTIGLATTFPVEKLHDADLIIKNYD